MDFGARSASYRVRVALAMKGMHAEEVSVDLLKGKQNEGDYLAVNPQGVVPALVLDEGGPPLFQSLAILEYLEEARPQPALLPKDPRGRARVRGLALIAAADGHPLVVPRVRSYLEKELKAGRGRRATAGSRTGPCARWKRSKAISPRRRRPASFCHGDALDHRRHLPQPRR